MVNPWTLFMTGDFSLFHDPFFIIFFYLFLFIELAERASCVLLLMHQCLTVFWGLQNRLADGFLFDKL